jgi:hypothetical protein
MSIGRRGELISSLEVELNDLREKEAPLIEELARVRDQVVEVESIIAALRGEVRPAPIAKPRRRQNEPRISEEQVRDWVVKTQKFTAVDFGREFNYTRASTAAAKYLDPLVERGILRQTSTVGPGGRLHRRYEYVRPEPGPVRHEFRDLAKEIDARNGAAPVPGTGAMAFDKRVMEPLRPYLSQLTIKHLGGGHLKVINKATGQSFTCGSTPGNNVEEAMRSRLRSIGVLDNG